MELEKLQKIIAEVLNVDEAEVNMDTTFVDDLGADSLDVFQIVMGIEEEFRNCDRKAEYKPDRAHKQDCQKDTHSCCMDYHGIYPLPLSDNLCRMLCTQLGY